MVGDPALGRCLPLRPASSESVITQLVIDSLKKPPIAYAIENSQKSKALKLLMKYHFKFKKYNL